MSLLQACCKSQVLEQHCAGSACSESQQQQVVSATAGLLGGGLLDMHSAKTSVYLRRLALASCVSDWGAATSLDVIQA